MDVPDPSFWFLVAGGAAAVSAGLAGVIWADVRSKLTKLDEKKAEKEEVEWHRDRIIVLFEKLEAHARRDEDHFRGLGEMISENHAEILRELAKKADRQSL